MRMKSLDDPLPVLEAIRLGMMPVVRAEGVDCYADLDERCFRLVSRPRVCMPFESPSGQAIVRAIRMVEFDAEEQAEV